MQQSDAPRPMPDWWHRLAAEEMRLLCADPTGTTWREMLAPNKAPAAQVEEGRNGRLGAD